MVEQLASEPESSVEVSSEDVAHDAVSVADSIPAPDEPHDGSVKRPELIAILVITVIAGWLRFCYSERLAVEHFDEGVYASNIWFGNTREPNYPAQHLYAPPLLPMLIELTFLITGPSNQWAMLPCQLLGMLTPLVLWRMGREWSGGLVGLGAALLCALSETHILLSRSALTDVPLGFFWLLAMFKLREACNTGHTAAALLAGTFTGLAWWTKYNGWMPLGIVLAAICLRAIFLIRNRDPHARVLIRAAFWAWSIAAAMAVTMWLMWVWSLQSKGGYQAVLANHRAYIVGLTGWSSSLSRQMDQLSVLSSGLSTLAICLTLVVVPVVMMRFGTRLGLYESETSEMALQPRYSIQGRLWVLFHKGIGLLLLLCFCVWSFAMLRVQAFIGLGIWLLLLSLATGTRKFDHMRDTANWLSVVWFLGMLLATPLYHPYFRLTIPWLLVAFLGAAQSILVVIAFRSWLQAEPLPDIGDTTATKIPKVNKSGIVMLVNTLILMTFGSTLIPAMRHALPHALDVSLAYPIRSSPRIAAEAMQKLVANSAADGESATAIYVFGEPALFFQLRLAGLQNVAPATNLGFADRPIGPTDHVYLVAGPHATQDPVFKSQFNQMQQRFKLIGTWTWHLSPLVALDQPECDPRHLGNDPNAMVEIHLYELLSQ